MFSDKGFSISDLKFLKSFAANYDRSYQAFLKHTSPSKRLRKLIAIVRSSKKRLEQKTEGRDYVRRN
jgi:hypothetical protein